MEIIQNYLTKNRCYQQNVKRTPIGIQLHTIGTAQGIPPRRWRITGTRPRCPPASPIW